MRLVPRLRSPAQSQRFYEKGADEAWQNKVFARTTSALTVGEGRTLKADRRQGVENPPPALATATLIRRADDDR